MGMREAKPGKRGGGEKPGNIRVGGGGGAKWVCVPSHNTILGC